MEHYQVRLVKRIDNGVTIITYPTLGKIYELHEQKTLRSYHTLDDAITRAKSFNQDLPPEVEGMVIVRLRTGKGTIASGSIIKPYIRHEARKKGITEWLSFIDRAGHIREIKHGTHNIDLGQPAESGRKSL